MLTQAYNPETGPLWRARFLPWSEDHSEFVNHTFVPAEGTTSEDRISQEAKHPSICHIVIGFHHSITDGHSSTVLTRYFLCLLNDLLSGVKVDDSLQQSTLVTGTGRAKSYEERKSELLANKSLLEARLQDLINCIRPTNIEKAYAVKPNLPLKTVAVPFILDQTRTQRFIKRCKSEGVTVQTAFCSLVHAAIIKLLNESKSQYSSCEVSSMHAMNMRKIYQEEDTALGVEVGHFNLIWEVPSNILDNFWAHAKSFHAKFKEVCLCTDSLDYEILEKLTDIDIMPYIPEEGRETPWPKLMYYLTSNMLDVTKILGDCGNKVHLEYISWTTNCRIDPHLWLNCLHTLRGRLLHSMQYNAGLLDHQTALRISQLIFEILTQVLER